MAEAGIIAPDERVELIEGEIIQMNGSPSGPIGKEHAVTLMRINRLIHALLDQSKYIIDQQNPV